MPAALCYDVTGEPVPSWVALGYFEDASDPETGLFKHKGSPRHGLQPQRLERPHGRVARRDAEAESQYCGRDPTTARAMEIGCGRWY